MLRYRCFIKSEIRLCNERGGKQTQLTFTCSNLTIEKLEKGVEYVQSQQ